MKPYQPSQIKPFAPAQIKPFGAPKEKPAPKTIDELCAGKTEQQQKTIRHRLEYEREAADTMDAGFFFSVVFKTKKERDAFIRDAQIELINDSFVYGSALIVND